MSVKFEGSYSLRAPLCLAVLFYCYLNLRVFIADRTKWNEQKWTNELQWQRTLALASTCAPFRRRMRITSVWLARAAKCNAVSPLTVVVSMPAPCCSRYSRMFMWPMNAATWRGVRPDYNDKNTTLNQGPISIAIYLQCSLLCNIGLQNFAFHSLVLYTFSDCRLTKPTNTLMSMGVFRGGRQPHWIFLELCLHTNTVQALLLCSLDPKNVKYCTRTPISPFASASGTLSLDLWSPFRKFLIHHLHCE